MKTGYNSRHVLLANPTEVAHVNRAALCCAMFEPDEFMTSYTIESPGELPVSRKHWTRVAPVIALSREFYALTLQARDRATTNPKVGHLLNAPRELVAANISFAALCPLSNLPLECRLDYWSQDKNAVIHLVLCDKPQVIGAGLILKWRLALIEAFTRHAYLAAFNKPLQHFYFLIVNAQGPGSIFILELEKATLEKAQIELVRSLDQIQEQVFASTQSDDDGISVVHLIDWGRSTNKVSDSAPVLIYGRPPQIQYLHESIRVHRIYNPDTLACLA